MGLPEIHIKTHSLDVRLPFGKALFFATGMVLLTAFLLEGLFRLPSIQARLMPQSYLLPDAYEIKLDFMAKLPARPDCFVLGSSVAHAGIHAAQLNESLAQSDRALTCFNFAAPGAIPAEQVAIAEFVLKEYQPRVLVLMVYFGDFKERPPESQDIAWTQSVWLRYKAGQVNAQGFLIEHSTLYRYILTYRKWATHDYEKLTTDTRLGMQLFGADGSKRDTRQFEKFGLAPDPVLDAAVFRFWKGYRVSADQLTALEAIIDQTAEHGVQLIVVEAPFHRSILNYVEDPEGDYQSFIDAVSLLLAERGISFLRMEDWSVLPDEVWADRNHLNKYGADLFTDWLTGPLFDALSQP